MVAPEQVDFVRVLDFERHEQAHRFQLMRAPIYIVAEEQVIIRFNVANILIRHTPQIEEPH